MGSGLEFFVRAFTYACAFIGAAWFGYYAYTVGFGAVDGDIIVAADDATFGLPEVDRRRHRWRDRCGAHATT